MSLLTSSKKHILVLPSWYPNDFNKRNGIFNQYYIDALSSLNNISVLHVEHRAEVQSVEIRKRTINNVLTIFVYVPIKNGFSGKIYNQSHFIKACEEGFKVITEEKGKVDLVHNMVIWKMGLFALRLKKKLNIPYIVTEHSTALMDKHKAYSSLQLRFIKKVLIQADKVTAVAAAINVVNTSFFIVFSLIFKAIF